MPAVLVTGTSAVGELVRLATNAGLAVLRKPVSPSELAEVLTTLPVPGPEGAP